MEPRMDYRKELPDASQKLGELSMLLGKCGLEPSLIDLVQIRASQINHCAFCLDMHVKEARLHDVREMKLHAVSVWRESPLFSDRERAALAWAESVTQIQDTHVPDADFAAAKKVFSNSELANLTMVIAVINAWNRLAVSFRTMPGSMDQALGLDKASMN